MTSPNWGLLQGGGFQNALAQGYQIGQQMRVRNEEKEYKNALSGYDPANPETIKPIMAARPEMGIQLQAQQEERARAEQDRSVKQMPIIHRLLTSVTDEATFQQAKQIAARHGIPLEGVPEQYDPQWVQSTRTLTQAFVERPEALSNAAKQATDMGHWPGTPQFQDVVRQLIEAEMATPYTDATGATRLYTPQIGGAGQVQGGAAPPTPGAVEDGYVFKGGNPADPASWEPVGGGGGNVTSNFLSGL